MSYEFFDLNLPPPPVNDSLYSSDISKTSFNYDFTTILIKTVIKKHERFLLNTFEKYF